MDDDARSDWDPSFDKSILIPELLLTPRDDYKVVGTVVYIKKKSLLASDWQTFCLPIHVASRVVLDSSAKHSSIDSRLHWQDTHCQAADSRSQTCQCLCETRIRESGRIVERSIGLWGHWMGWETRSIETWTGTMVRQRSLELTHEMLTPISVEPVH